MLTIIPRLPHCSICAATYDPNIRMCKFFPKICDYCEVEYCPCRVSNIDDVTLDRLKGRLALEISQYRQQHESESLQVVAGLGGYRKVIRELSRLLGGKTTSLSQPVSYYKSAIEVIASSGGLIGIEKP